MEKLSIYSYVEYFIIGLLLGGVYFYGLWITFKKIRENKKYVRILFVSWFLRMFLLGQNDYRRILTLLSGVLVVRYSSTFFLKVRKKGNGKL
ncbi:MAG: ATP synthase subunit I [Alphaproteobacteria bacterium]|nr:ATP synthase subunit I [Alphaproteobacteria bacterium]